MVFPSSPSGLRRSPFQLRQLAHENVRVAIDPGWPPVIEVIGELRVPPGHQIRFQAHAGEAVVPPGPPVAPQGRLGDPQGPFLRVVLNANAARDARTHGGARDDNAVIVVDLDPVVVLDFKLLGVVMINPERLAAAREGRHALVVAIG